jgi:hypothetical protein
MSPMITSERAVAFGAAKFTTFDGKSVRARTQTAVPREIANRVFPGLIPAEGESPREVRQGVLQSSEFSLLSGVSATFLNSTVGVVELPARDGEERVGFVGNTVLGGCPQGEKGCKDGCQFAQTRVSSRLLKEVNCAVGNTLAVFLEAQQSADGRFMMLPTTDDVIVVGDQTPGNPITMIDEHGNNYDAFFRLKPARAVVLRENWVKEKGLQNLTIGLNGADSTFGTMSLSVMDENFIVAFCTTRENLGDRDEHAQVLRKSVDEIMRIKNIPEEKREEVYQTLAVRIDVGASATLENFAHDIRLPDSGTPHS